MTVATNAELAETREVLKNSFVWMTIGLVFTSIITWFTAQSEFLSQFVVEQPVIALVSLGVWAILGLGFGFFVRHVPFVIGVVLFVIYCAFTGVTLSWIFTAYTEATILYALVSTVALFAVISVFALFTKIDLTKWWAYIIFAIVGTGIASALNIFVFQSDTLDFGLSIVGVVLFSISTAASVQKIARMEHELAPKLHNRAAIIGAMMLYTNFINLFLRLLEIYARMQRNNRNQN